MDAVASRGMLYRRHYTNGVNTRESMPTLFFSRYFIRPIFPFTNGIFYKPRELFRALDDEAVSFTRALSDAGIRTAGISAHQWFLPETELARQFDEWYDLPRELEYEKRYGYPQAAAVVDRAIAWIESTEPRDEFLLYLHLMDTHFPHFLEEDAREFFGADDYAAEGFDELGQPVDRSAAVTGTDREYLDALYDGDLRYADRELGRLFEFLRGRGELDTTLIAILSDHGEQLLHEPGLFAHGDWREPVARTPMILAYPGHVPVGETEALTQNVDLHPTLLRLLDVPMPAKKSADGLDLLSGLEGGERPFVLARNGARFGDTKFLCWFDDLYYEQVAAGNAQLWGRYAELELYDLAADPTEQRNLWAEDPARSTEVLRRYADATRPYLTRYLEATADVQPPGEFAVFPSHVAPQPGLPTCPSPGSFDDLDALPSERGWIHCTDGRGAFLMAKVGAEPLEATLPVPSGSYDVQFSLDGACRIRIEGAADEGDVLLEGRPLGDHVVLRFNTEVEQVDVTGGELRFRLTPVEGRAARLYAIGFRPHGEDPTDDAENAERLEALRQLGYTE